MTCGEAFAAYSLRAIGIGERLLPREDFTLCQQISLIGSGMLWNIYFGALALGIGFFIANGVAIGKA
ncbi:MAG: amino acid ABC transporter permease, partial [Planctomycetota bacterium]